MENNAVISKYGVTLKRLTLDKIELVRNWRNDPKISQYMEFRDYITSEMQGKWFERINNKYNYYFIINYDMEEIGLVNIKDVDFYNRCAESGIFIYNDKYLNTDIGFRSALCNTDFAFEVLKLDYLYGHVMSDNKRALRFNKAFGCVLQGGGGEDKVKQRLILKKDIYFEYRKRLIAMLKISA
jgi:RimJ/RimL family protein N-acetyltransferase